MGTANSGLSEANGPGVVHVWRACVSLCALCVLCVCNVYVRVFVYNVCVCVCGGSVCVRVCVLILACNCAIVFHTQLTEFPPPVHAYAQLHSTPALGSSTQHQKEGREEEGERGAEIDLKYKMEEEGIGEEEGKKTDCYQ